MREYEWVWEGGGGECFCAIANVFRDVCMVDGTISNGIKNNV